MSARVITTLNELIAADYDAIAAYEAAGERLTASATRRQFEIFLDDHRQHVETLTRAVKDLGGTPPSRGDYRQLLGKGRIYVGLLAGQQGLLAAMRSNALTVHERYRRAAFEEHLPAGLAKRVQQFFRDECLHVGFIEDQKEGSLAATLPLFTDPAS